MAEDVTARPVEAGGYGAACTSRRALPGSSSMIVFDRVTRKRSRSTTLTS